MISKITTARVGGLALMVGAALYIISTLITAVFVIEWGDVSDVYSNVDAIADAPHLTGFATILGLVSLMILLWGMVVMWQTAQNECALDVFVKFGLAGVIFAVILLIMAEGFTYVTSHVVEHGIGSGSDPDQTGRLIATGVHMQAVANSTRLIAGVSGVLGHLVLGFAWARKFLPGAYRIMARVVGVVSIVFSIGMLMTEPIPDLIELLSPILTALLVLYLAWWIVIGVGVYLERFGLRVGKTPEH